jgi:hypothetical protein
LLRSDNLHYLLWFGEGHTARRSFVPSKTVFRASISLLSGGAAGRSVVRSILNE